MKLAALSALALVAAVARPTVAAPAPIKTDGDLPADLAIDADGGVLRSGSVEVELGELFDDEPDDPSECEPQFSGARYDRAKHTLLIAEPHCAGGDKAIPRARVIAALARARGWAAEVRGDLAEAQRQLAAALAAAPSERLALDLALVQLALGDRAGAAATMRPYLGKAAIEHYAAFVANPALAPLLDEPPLASLRASAPGKARVTGLDAPLVAYSAAHDRFAVLREAPIGDTCASEGSRDKRDVEVAIVDRGGRVTARLSLLPPRWADTAWIYRDLRDDADEIAGRIATANRFLRDLGFDPITGAEISRFTLNARRSTVARFPVAKLGLAERDGTVRLLRGNQIVGDHALYRCPRDHFSCEYPPALLWAAWLPAQHVVLIAWESSGAEHSDRDAGLDVWELPSAP